MKYRIEVKTKDEFRDTRGDKSLSEIKEIGILGIRQVKYSAIYLIEADFDEIQAEKIARELLADAVSEDFFVVAVDSPLSKGGVREADGGLLSNSPLSKGGADEVDGGLLSNSPLSKGCAANGGGGLPSNSPLSKGGAANGGGGLSSFCVREADWSLPPLPRNKDLKELSRHLRKNATRQENHLWYDYLKNYTPRFTRQRIIGNFITDFFCHDVNLVVELDGAQHYREDDMDYDNKRTGYLRGLGIEVLRFTNIDVDENFDGVCIEISRVVEERRQTPAAVGGTPFQKGATASNCILSKGSAAISNSPLSKGGVGEAGGGLISNSPLFKGGADEVGGGLISNSPLSKGGVGEAGGGLLSNSPLFKGGVGEADGGLPIAAIEIWHKKGAADPSAESIIKAIKDLKTQAIVKTAHKYYLHGQISQKDLEKIAVKLFANTLIQDYKIEYPEFSNH